MVAISPLLALYAYSVGVKSDRRKAAAQAKAEAQSKVHNWVIDKGTGVPRRLGPLEKLKDGEKIAFFTLGTETTPRKMDDFYTAENVDLFVNPFDPEGSEITRKEFNTMAKRFQGVEGTNFKLGKAVGQRSPADNKMIFYEGYAKTRFPEKGKRTYQQKGKLVKKVFVPLKKGVDQTTATHAREVVEREDGTFEKEGKPYSLVDEGSKSITEYAVIDATTNTYSVLDEGSKQKATHTRIVKKKANGDYEEIAKWEEIDPKTKIKDEQELIGFYDKDNNEVTFESGQAVKSFKYKGRDDKGKPNITEAPEDLVQDKDREIVLNLDKDRKPTSDPDKEVYTQKFLFNKENPKGVAIGNPQLIPRPEKEKAKPTQDFRITIKNPSGQIVKGLASELGISNQEVISRHGSDLLINSTITTNADGIVEEKAYMADKTAKSSNDAKDSDKFYSPLKLKSSTDNGFFGKQDDTYKFKRALINTPMASLADFNSFLLKDDTYIDQINNDARLLAQTRGTVMNLLQEFFTKSEIDAKGMVRYPNLPKNPEDAQQIIMPLFTNIKGLRGLKNFDLMIKQTAGFMGNEEAKRFSESAFRNPGESVLTVVEKDGENGSKFIGVNYPSQFETLVNNVLPQYVVKKDNVNGVIAMLIKSKKDNNGQTIFKENDQGKLVRQLSDDQGLLVYLNDLHKKELIGKTVTVNGVKRNATYLDAFFSIIHPYPRNTNVGNITGDAREEIVTGFNQVAQNNFREGLALIMGFTDVNSKQVTRTLEQLHGGDTDNVKVRGEIEGKRTSAFNAMITIDAMLDTYITSEGKAININTEQGGLVVRVSGMFETGKKVLRLFKGDSLVDIMADSVDDVTDRFIDPSQDYDSIDIINGINDPKEKAAREKNLAELARIKRMMNGDFGEKGTFGFGESDFVKSMPASMRSLYKRGQLGKEVIRKLAIRQYHKFMLAYQLAAAIQGGTGGRTISDQDVQNILTSLNFGFFTEASLERATLLQARNMMQMIYDYNNALLSKDTVQAYSAIKARELLFEGSRKFGFLGVGNKDGLAGVNARRNFIMKNLSVRRPNQTGKDTKPKVDVDATNEAEEIMRLRKLEEKKK